MTFFKEKLIHSINLLSNHSPVTMVTSRINKIPRPKPASLIAKGMPENYNTHDQSQSFFLAGNAGLISLIGNKTLDRYASKIEILYKKISYYNFNLI